MEVSVEDLSTVKKILHIEIPAVEVSRKLDDAYSELRKTAKVKGFRPGKVPRSILERMFQKEVHADIKSKIIDESYSKALENKAFVPLETPQVDPPELTVGEPYKYDVTFEIKPEIGDIDFKGLKITKNCYRISEDEVESQLKMLQKSMTRFGAIKESRPVRKGDDVLMDFEGFKDGKPFEETQKTVNFIMKIGKGTISPDLDNALIGMMPEETKEVPVRFPESYPNKKLAGLEITFQITVKEIREEVLPDIDDAFAAQVGDFKTLDELKAKMRENLKQGYDKRTEQEMNEQMFSQLLEKAPFEVPETLVKLQLKGIIAELEQSLAYHNQTMADKGLTNEIIEEKYRDIAIKQVKRFLLMDKLIQQEKLTVPDEESEAQVQIVAQSLQVQSDELRKFYADNPDKMESLKLSMLEQKAVRLVLEHSIIDEVIPSDGPEEKPPAES